AKKRSNFFSLVVNIYLIGSSVKRRVFKTLAGFRLYYSYYSANYTIGSITEEVKIFVIYNNINFKDIKRDELLGHTFIIRSLMTTAIIYYPKLPPSGLC
ncbi:hypothetical protein V2W45_1230156, partial [Cenococcum geophilum]